MQTCTIVDAEPTRAQSQQIIFYRSSLLRSAADRFERDLLAMQARGYTVRSISSVGGSGLFRRLTLAVIYERGS